jgi:hypothetical protein
LLIAAASTGLVTLEPDVAAANVINISLSTNVVTVATLATLVELFRVQEIVAPSAGSDPVVARVISQPAIFAEPPPAPEPPNMFPNFAKLMGMMQLET